MQVCFHEWQKKWEVKEDGKVPQDQQYQKPQQPQAGGLREEARFPKPRRRGYLANTGVIGGTEATEWRQLLLKMLSEVKQEEEILWFPPPLSTFNLLSVPQTGWAQLEVNTQWRPGNQTQRAWRSTSPYRMEQVKGEAQGGHCTFF